MHKLPFLNTNCNTTHYYESKYEKVTTNNNTKLFSGKGIKRY